eukprot:TRINITY_DN6698_c0_g1_i1.p2 TRINITY_DN6698_c0_g1~~TRINITY_DN6698_c0_g1_i1.p2  ORF type:complete len:167 (-),score=28.20 TRINITY_DN6698_c0_g1_i1:464-895(-)
MKGAIAAQLNNLLDTQPDCRVVLVEFGSTVTVHTDSASVRVDGRTLDQFNSLINKGKSLSARVQAPIRKSFKNLTAKTIALHTSGCTALGPALAIAAGISSGTPGAKILVCTDGCANTGIGNVSGSKNVPFYAEVSQKQPLLL